MKPQSVPSNIAGGVALNDSTTNGTPATPVTLKPIYAHTRGPRSGSPAAQETPAKNFFDLTGRVAVVVGGTSGLGESIAIALAEAGAHVVATGRREERVQELSSRIKQLGRRTLPHTVDVADRQSVDELRAAVEREFGGIDILVNSAGATFKKPTMSVTEPEWDRLLDINLTGTLRACQAFYPLLKAANGRGRIINIASLASFVAFHQVAAYGVSKAGVLALTRSLGIEWAREGICVNAIVPGIFVTELNESLLNGTDRGRELLARTPMQRFGNAQELTGAAIYLASDAARFMTGQTLTIDGGFLASGVNS